MAARRDADRTGKQIPQNTTKIKKYRKPLNINLGMVIFGFIFVYIAICVFMSFKEKRISGYVVAEGALSSNKVYEGIILREEVIVTSDRAGYIYYYPGEGEKVGVGNMVYAIDETGQLADMMASEQINDEMLSDQSINLLKTELVEFVHGFSAAEFNSVYDFKYLLKNNVLKLSNASLTGSIAALSGSNGASVKNCYAGMSGVISYWTDGYEEMIPENVTLEMFDRKDYQKQQLTGNDLVELGGAVYKLNTSEIWSVLIPFDAEQGAMLIEDESGYIKVRFLKNQYESWAEMSMVTNYNGDSFLKLTFNNSMLTFVNDRFINIELILNDETGLKIPNSSIVEKEFFLVPHSYITKGGKNGNDGVLRQSYLEDGTVTSEFIETSIYNETEEDYYLDTSELRIGDILLMPDSAETYVVSKRATLIGVYNINKGYADFRRIDILNQNDEYSIVKSNSRYGLNVYDYIVLDSQTVDENEFLYD